MAHLFIDDKATTNIERMFVEDMDHAEFLCDRALVQKIITLKGENVDTAIDIYNGNLYEVGQTVNSPISVEGLLANDDDDEDPGNYYSYRYRPKTAPKRLAGLFDYITEEKEEIKKTPSIFDDVNNMSGGTRYYLSDFFVFANGVPKHYTGVYTTYATNGQVHEVIEYVNGTKHGKCSTYYVGYRSGCEPHIMRSCEYRNGELYGVYTDYFPSGAIAKKFTYVNGKENGEFTTFFENGKKRIECFLVNGKCKGKYIEYNFDGTIKKQIEYESSSTD